MGEVKSSVYVDVDGELWRRLKKAAAERGVEVSELLEGLVREELMLNIEEALLKLVSEGALELDFDPVEPVGGLVSSLVRELRDGREGRLLRYERDSQEVR